MSNVETVKQIYAALNRNDIPAVLEFFDPSIVRIEFEGLPMAGTYKGLTEVGIHFTNGRSTWGEGGCFIEETETHRDKVVVKTHVHVRLKDKSEWLEGYTGDVWTFRNGLVTEFRTFQTPEEALTWTKAQPL